MKFGNYNLTTETANRRHLFLFRIKKVKSTANYIVGKVHRKLGTLKTRMHQMHRHRHQQQPPSPTPAAAIPGGSISVTSTTATSISRRLRPPGLNRSESPLSYRASLFDERNIGGGGNRLGVHYELPLADIQVSGSVGAYALKKIRCQLLSGGRATDEILQVPGWDRTHDHPLMK
ncbi:hypothetical protein RP20_CCG016681 [Aedes albopictus]|nr:hypothetical protein RP20_CCG016681 [Aedes albopictus]